MSTATGAAQNIYTGRDHRSRHVSGGDRKKSSPNAKHLPSDLEQWVDGTQKAKSNGRPPSSVSETNIDKAVLPKKKTAGGSQHSKADVVPKKDIEQADVAPNRTSPSIVSATPSKFSALSSQTRSRASNPTVTHRRTGQDRQVFGMQEIPEDKSVVLEDRPKEKPFVLMKKMVDPDDSVSQVARNRKAKSEVSVAPSAFDGVVSQARAKAKKSVAASNVSVPNSVFSKVTSKARTDNRRAANTTNSIHNGNKLRSSHVGSLVHSSKKGSLAGSGTVIHDDRDDSAQQFMKSAGFSQELRRRLMNIGNQFFSDDFESVSDFRRSFDAFIDDLRHKVDQCSPGELSVIRQYNREKETLPLLKSEESDAAESSEGSSETKEAERAVVSNRTYGGEVSLASREYQKQFARFERDQGYSRLPPSQQILLPPEPTEAEMRRHLIEMGEKANEMDNPLLNNIKNSYSVTRTHDDGRGSTTRGIEYSIADARAAAAIQEDRPIGSYPLIKRIR